MNDNVADKTDTDAVYAAIDLGSNSFHMLVASPDGNSIRLIDSLRTALDALAQYAERLTDIPLKNIRVVGTNTLRRAKKTQRFMSEANRLLGKPIEIISGREEARLIYSAVSHIYPDSNQRLLVVDIGGGSTELASGLGNLPTLLESVNMGCVSYTNRFLNRGETITASGMKAGMRSLVALEPSKPHQECSPNYQLAMALLHEPVCDDYLA